MYTSHHIMISQSQSMTTLLTVTLQLQLMEGYKTLRYLSHKNQIIIETARSDDAARRIILHVLPF